MHSLFIYTRISVPLKFMDTWHKPLLAILQLIHFLLNCSNGNVHQLHEYKRVWKSNEKCGSIGRLTLPLHTYFKPLRHTFVFVFNVYTTNYISCDIFTFQLSVSKGSRWTDSIYNKSTLALVFIICTGYFRTIHSSWKMRFDRHDFVTWALLYLSIIFGHLPALLHIAPSRGPWAFCILPFMFNFYSPQPNKVLKMVPSGSQMCVTRN
jgi:hypothetical protein